MYNQENIIIVVIAIIINSIVFGYVASNSKKNRINQAYLLFLTFIILYTVFDCIIINMVNITETKDIIVKAQAGFWMPLSILYLNFIYLFLRKPKDELFNIFIAGIIIALIFTLFSNKVIIGYKGYNFGTMAFTGTWFLPITLLLILPPAFYALYLIGKEGKIFNYRTKKTKEEEPLFSLQLKILFFGSLLCLIIAVTTNIFFDEVLGYSGELHLASLSLSVQSTFLLPALIKYNFLNKPIEKLGDELHAQSSDAVFVTNQKGNILNLNKAARKMFDLKGKIYELDIKSLIGTDFDIHKKYDNYETKININLYITITKTNILKGNQALGKIFIIRDISQLKRTEKKLLQTTKELILAQNVASLGSFTYDIKKDNVTWSDQLYNIYGRDKKKFIPTKDSFFNEIVHSESKKMTLTKTDNAIKNKVRNLDYVHKTLMPNGEVKWFQALIKITYNKKNEAIIMNGTSQDVTELFLTRINLEKSELRLKKAQEIAKLGSWESNEQTGEIYWSDILKNMFGLKKKDTVKKGDFWKKIHPDDLNWMKERWQKAEIEKTPYSGTFRVKLKNGKIKHLMEHAEFIKNSKGELIKTIGTVMETTELHQYEEELRKLSSHIQNVQEDERGRIAREIHDALGQRLTSITMDLSFLKNKMKENSSIEIMERLTALSVLTEETIQLTRKISQELRPSILDDLGLISAIDWLKEQYNQRSNIHFKLDMPSDEIEINSDYATAVFRITQEALTNIIKHANAKNVNIKMKFKKSEIFLMIEDDGMGIGNKLEIKNNKTFGVFGMKERARILGGKLKIRNNIGEGTTVNLTLPYKQKQANIQ